MNRRSILLFATCLILGVTGCSTKLVNAEAVESITIVIKLRPSIYAQDIKVDSEDFAPVFRVLDCLNDSKEIDFKHLPKLVLPEGQYRIEIKKNSNEIIVYDASIPGYFMSENKAYKQNISGDSDKNLTNFLRDVLFVAIAKNQLKIN